jgi:hypothetical protein
VNVAALIIDYVILCEQRSELLDFGAFIELWTVADEIAVDTVAQ